MQNDLYQRYSVPRAGELQDGRISYIILYDILVYTLCTGLFIPPRWHGLIGHPRYTCRSTSFVRFLAERFGLCERQHCTHHRSHRNQRDIHLDYIPGAQSMIYIWEMSVCAGSMCARDALLSFPPSSIRPAKPPSTPFPRQSPSAHRLTTGNIIFLMPPSLPCTGHVIIYYPFAWNGV